MSFVPNYYLPVLLSVLLMGLEANPIKNIHLKAAYNKVPNLLVHVIEKFNFISMFG